MAALAVALVAGGWGYLQYRFDQFKKVHVAHEVDQVPGQPFNVLVLGSDSRVGESSPQFGSSSVVQGQRSDVDMIVHVVPATRQVSILSIPRDTLVSMVGQDASEFGRFNRINASYNSGADQVVQTIEDNFGIPINHVVQVDFAGFEGAVSALGGVWMNFAYPARDAWSGLDITTPGCQLLNGQQALAVARSRHYQYYADGYWHSDPTGDLGRIQRQDAFLRALASAARAQRNPLTLNAFLGSLPQGLVIDDRFTVGSLLGLAQIFRSVDPASIQTFTLPTISDGYVSPWGDVLFVDQPAAQQMLVSVLGTLQSPSDPPPGTNLVPEPPPDVTTTTAPAPGAGSGSGTTGHPATTTAPPAPVPPPPFDPTACAPQ
ncbi:MAG TPA: LCP family protein [Acidimicrobiales bacterium]|nr:LCP family protein [Acidimicrobiales bacterium]